MASNFYEWQLPDYRDIDNQTGKRPGYRVSIVEQDGGVGLRMDSMNQPPDGNESTSVFMNIEEARDLAKGLRQAIERAEPKNTPRLAHERRGREL